MAAHLMFLRAFSHLSGVLPCSRSAAAEGTVMCLRPRPSLSFRLFLVAWTRFLARRGCFASILTVPGARSRISHGEQPQSAKLGRALIFSSPLFLSFSCAISCSLAVDVAAQTALLRALPANFRCFVIRRAAEGTAVRIRSQTSLAFRIIARHGSPASISKLPLHVLGAASTV